MYALPTSFLDNAKEVDYGGNGKRRKLDESVPSPADELAIFLDGVCPMQRSNATHPRQPAGWGAVVVVGCHRYRGLPSGGQVVASLCGPVDTDHLSPHFRGADVETKNAAELLAMCHGLEWVMRSTDRRQPLAVCSGSLCAIHQVQGTWQSVACTPTCNIARALVAEASRTREVRFVHVPGNQGNRWHDLADRLARLGSSGARRGVESASRMHGHPPRSGVS